MYVLLFDIDGTLIASGGAGKAALEDTLETEFGLRGIPDHLDFRGRTDRAIVQDLFRLHVIEETPENWSRLLNGYFRHLPQCLQRCAGRILPGVTALLEEMTSRQDVLLGLLTGNTREGARLKLGHYGLFDYFRFGGFGDLHLERNAVAQEALTEAHRQSNGAVQPDRIWVIGDTPLDVRCARFIGARAVAVCTGWHPREELEADKPDLLLEDLTDPSALLACLTS